MKIKLSLGTIWRAALAAAAPILAEKAAEALRKGADKLAKKKQA